MNLGGKQVKVDLAARNAKTSCFAAFYAGEPASQPASASVACSCTARHAVLHCPLQRANQCPSSLIPTLAIPPCPPTLPPADCEHEILPVTAGHRLCLVYNLSFTGRGPPPPAIPGGATSGRRLPQQVQCMHA